MRAKRQMAVWLASVALLLATAVASAQQPFPTFKGGNARTGKNADPYASQPGEGNLRWFHPTTLDNIGGRITIDNTHAAPMLQTSGTWTDAPTDGEAGNPFIPSGAGDLPAYKYATTIESAAGSDPTVPLNAPDLRVLTFEFTPTLTVPQNFALYVWLPIGATTISGTSTFPQRYFVYEVTYGSGQRHVEVVDTFLAGTGWVRLGAGGLPTNELFAYNGVDPIRIKLYNTIPRDENGDLQDVPGTLVYGDAAMAVPEVGTYVATPTVFSFLNGVTTETRVIAALNARRTETVDGQNQVTERGQVTSYNHADGVRKWTFELGTTGNADSSGIILDNQQPGVTAQFPFLSNSVAPGYYAVDYFDAPITNDLNSMAVVSYEALLDDADYEVWVYLAGDGAGETFGHNVRYEVHEGSTVTTMTLDQSGAAGTGWVRLGTRRFRHRDLVGQPLIVYVTNYSADGADIGRKAYADAVLFVGATNHRINSTPVQAVARLRHTPGGPLVETPVVVVAGDDGKLYCLDAVGNVDGTTTVYWTFPSTPNRTVGGWTDPNHVPALDGTNGIAEMPKSFDTSSALIYRTAAGEDLLYIAATNGRVYCIEMAGRGDRDTVNNVPGTTVRRWTYPNDYPGGLIMDPPQAGITVQGAYSAQITASGFYGTDYYAAPITNTLGSEQNVEYAPALLADDYDIYAWLPGNSGGENFGQNVEYRIFEGATETKVVVNQGVPPASVNGRFVKIGTRKFRHFPGTGNLRVQVTNYSAAPADLGRESYADAVWFVGDNLTVTSQLGSFRGSVALEEIGGQPTLFVPAPQGRLYALDALGDPNTKRTSVLWTFPALTAPTLGPILHTPAVEFGKVYFGTTTKDGTTGGTFYALDAATGALAWSFTGGPGSPADNFLAAPVTASTALLSGIPPKPVMPDTVFVHNENRYTYALEAHGNPLTLQTTLLWQTNELNAGSSGSLTFTPMEVFNAGGALEVLPTVIVPTADGRIMSLFAHTSDVNRFTQREAYRFTTSAPLLASVSVGFNWMFAADVEGFIYAFNDGTGLINPGTGPVPGQEGVPPNNPVSQDWDQTEVVLIKKPLYDTLRAPTVAGVSPNFDTAANTANHTPLPAKYEWGQTVYAMAYRYPYRNTGPSGAAPLVNFQVSSEGATLRQIGVDSRRFQAGVIPTHPVSGANLDGYALLAFTIQGSGSNALPPGIGRIQVSISTDTVGTGTRTVSLDPAKSLREFNIANPLAIVMPGGTTDPDYQMGLETDPLQPLYDQNLVNGSPDVANTPTNNESLLAATVRAVPHGQTGTVRVQVVDRSLMTLVRGNNRGLDFVRVQLRDLEWQGGKAATAASKPIPGADDPNSPYFGFEDYPERTPNDSRDYPNITRGAIRVVKDRFGEAENPLFSGATLKAPTGFDPNDETKYASRTLNHTDFDFDVDIPRYQPPNLSELVDSKGNNYPAGYSARVYVYVDSSGNGTFDLAGTRREAFRTFTLGAQVPADERFSVGTPVVDLGSLASGSGYTPVHATDAASVFSPWSGGYEPMFRNFTVQNEGNVNLLNLRLAKGRYDGTAFEPWALNAASNDLFSWLDGSHDLWSDLDYVATRPNAFALTPNVILQKPRVGDRSPSRLSTNPIRRENGVVGVTQSTLLESPEPSSPRVSVSVPLGFPTGSYSELVTVIEDSINVGGSFSALDMNGNAAAETFSDPSFTLKFNVRDTQLTNSANQYGVPLLDNLIPYGTTPDFRYGNYSPTGMRDPNGHLTVAWTSDRPSFVPAPATPTEANRNERGRIYIGTVRGSTQAAAPGASPLRDLYAFQPANASQWFSQQVGPYPNLTQGQLDTLFAVGTNESVLAITTSFRSPSLPSNGVIDPFTGATLASAHLAFVGDTQVQTQTGRKGESRLMASTVTVDASGNVTIGAPVAMPNDTQVAKGRPSLVQWAAGSTIFYSAGGTGESALYYVPFDGTEFGNPSPITLPNGFESAFSPNATARPYVGDDPAKSGDFYIELSFAGKLRGRPNSEVFLTRLKSDNTGLPTAMTAFEQIVKEALTPEAETGLYRSAGISWANVANVELWQELGASSINLEVPNTRNIDQATGVVSFDSRVGGRVVLDPNMGTIRFTAGAPRREATLRLTYQPRILRVSGSTSAGYSGPSIQFDNRYVADLGYWRRGDNSTALNGDLIRAGRLVTTFGRAAAGQGQSARPYMRTQRFGVQLSRPIHTQANGTVTKLQVTAGAAPSFYQIDPANRKVYFTAADEDLPVTVVYNAADETTGQLIVDNLNNPVDFTENITVRLITEREESAVPIDEALNEAAMITFLDPFDPNTVADLRPGLIWMLWSSTRRGGSDVFMQTMAPRFTPRATRQGNP